MAADEDLISGWRFSATMQLRTPLRFLLRHGQIIPSAGTIPEVEDQRHYSWIPVVKTFKELGIDIPEVIVPGRTMASEIGQIPTDGGDYLPFLIEVRKVVEGSGSVSYRMTELRRLLSEKGHQEHCQQLGGADAISARFFPRFIDTLPRLSASAVEALGSLGLTTPAKIGRADDAQLRAIKGIGPAVLSGLRASCAVAVEQQSDRADLVQR